MPPFIDFETDPGVIGLHWDSFVSALGVWVHMQDDAPTVEAAANAFNTTPGAVRKAVNEHPWLVDHWPGGETDPAKQVIAEDGE